MQSAEHVPDRPSWDCRACGKPWPCDPEREQLTEEYARHPLSLNLYLASQYAMVLEDLVGSVAPVPTDLYERFIGWARSAR